VLAAVKFAEKSPQPPLDTLYDYTYANGAAAAGSPGESDEPARDGVVSREDRR